MALKPDSERPGAGLPDEYAEHHPDERPGDWGWHGEWGRAARIAGLVVAVILCLMITATHYNLSGAGWLLLFAVGLVVGVGWDMHRSRNTWRR